MRRTALYSSARAAPAPVQPPAPEPQAAPAATPSVRSAAFLRCLPPGWRLPMALALLMLLMLGGGMLIQSGLSPVKPAPTQAELIAGMRRDLASKPLPSTASAAYARIAPSVVRVAGLGHPDPVATPLDARKAGKKRPRATPAPKADKDDSDRTSIGTGVVITEQGAILTSLHVVHGASKIMVSFADGSESPAVITGLDPDNDLAVLRATQVPDDLKPAVLVSTAGLRPGDEVAAVGFPFGYGPSVSSGVVSGLKREFRAENGERVLGNLIQFDAAANPGNSGGPLVNNKGEVLGIVAALLNPVQQRFFVGLGFAVPIENAAGAIGLSPF